MRNLEARLARLESAAPAILAAEVMEISALVLERLALTAEKYCDASPVRLAMIDAGLKAIDERLSAIRVPLTEPQKVRIAEERIAILARLDAMDAAHKENMAQREIKERNDALTAAADERRRIQDEEDERARAAYVPPVVDNCGKTWKRPRPVKPWWC